MGLTARAYCTGWSSVWNGWIKADFCSNLSWILLCFLLVLKTGKWIVWGGRWVTKWLKDSQAFACELISLYNTPSRVVLRAKEAVHTLLPTPCLHGCMSWEGFASPMFPHSQVLRKINHSLFLWVIKIMHAEFWVWVLDCILRQA